MSATWNGRWRTVAEHLRGGISTRFIDGTGLLLSFEWNRAGQSGAVVGRCRHMHCPGLMIALPTHTNGKHIWYGAQCLTCGCEIASLNGATLPRSSLRSEMPDGAWQRRAELLKATFDKQAAQAA